MIFVSLGSTEGIIVALIMIALNIIQDKTESKPTDVFGGSVNQSSVILLKKGHYFCPSYCEVDHPHRAHSEEYLCESDPCPHFIVKQWGKNSFLKVKNKLD